MFSPNRANGRESETTLWFIELSPGGDAGRSLLSTIDLLLLLLLFETFVQTRGGKISKIANSGKANALVGRPTQNHLVTERIWSEKEE